MPTSQREERESSMTETSIAPRRVADVDAVREVLATIAADMAADAHTLEGEPFNGATVGEYLGHLGAAVAVLAQVVSTLLPDSPEVKVCPRCQQPVVPNADGTLPGHQIQPGPKRAPICRFRGVPS